MQKVYVENNEFDRSGNDYVTSFFAGLFFLPVFFAALVFLLGGCEA
jgi:hypothetical protein